MTRTNWYEIRAHADAVDVAITGDIEASTAPDFLRSLPQTARTICLYVASLGGDPNTALQIAQALKGHRARVEVTVGAIDYGETYRRVNTPAVPGLSSFDIYKNRNQGARS